MGPGHIYSSMNSEDTCIYEDTYIAVWYEEDTFIAVCGARTHI